MMRKKVALACSNCNHRNYTIEKASNDNIRLEIKKYCKSCNAHTLHRETK